ncbi:MAG: hypothetical protein KBS57_04095 [Alistipes sp.]|nr:hypothetical protein [Candidatus Minthomonas equi]
MKKIQGLILLVVMTVVWPQKAEARNYKERDFDYYPHNEIYLQYGTPSAIEFMGKTRNFIADPDPSYSRVCESRNHKYSGVGGIGYSFSVSPVFSFGVYGGFSWSQADVYTLAENGKPVQEFLTYTSSIKNWTVMVSGTYLWWQQGAMELSSALYLGASFLDESLSNNKYPLWDKEDSRTTFAYHITAAKFRFGDIVGGFVELGFGYRGIVNLGLSVKL